MSTPLFLEVRNRRLARTLRDALGSTYAPKVIERTGTVISSGLVLVDSQRYKLSNAPADVVIGGSLAVQNIARSAAAVYAPVYGGSSVVVTGGGTVSADSSAAPSVDAVTKAGADLRVASKTMQRAGNGILLFSGTGAVLREFAATADGLDAASVAAVAGDLVLLPPLTITGDHTLTAGVHYVGSARYGTILSGQITGASSSSLAQLSITRTANDASLLAAVVGPDVGSLQITDCELSATQAGAGTGYAISVQAGDVYVYDSRLYGSTALTDEV